MNPMSLLLLLALAFACGGVRASAQTAGIAAVLLDDRAITPRRKALIEFIWGADGFPTPLPEVVANIANPVAPVQGFARVDELRIDMAPVLQGLAYHFLPKQPNGELVVVHHGHSADFAGDYGLVSTMNA